MTTALTVASYIRSRIPSSMWSLQKLTYFSQAWSLGINGRRLFDESVRAWRDGPVVASVYREDRHRYIPKYEGGLSESDRALIDAVLVKYSGMTSQQLIDLSHEDKPWQDARLGAAPSAYTDNPMSTKAIQRLYVARAISGEGVPNVAAPFTPVSDEDAARAGAEVVARWKTALDLLATR